MARNMGFDFGLENPDACFKRKNRWLFKIESVSAEGVDTLPPSKSARPNISFKEIETQHLNETIFFPGKPDWKPVNLTLFDVKSDGLHPVFEWLKELYDPQEGTFVASCDGFKKQTATLEMYDGCGEIIETWVYENIWPQSVEFGDLDMSTSDLVVCDLTLRYDRAYIEQ
jgi:hypothetical protein